MTKWKDGKLDLWRLGYLETWGHDPTGWYYAWNEERPFYGDKPCATEAAAQRAAVRWLRAALKQAGKRIGGV